MKTQAGVTLGIRKPHSALLQLCELKGVTDCCEPISVTAKRDPKSGLIKATTKRCEESHGGDVYEPPAPGHRVL